MKSLSLRSDSRKVHSTKSLPCYTATLDTDAVNLYFRTYFFSTLFGEPNPDGPCGTKALRFPEKVPSILLVSLAGTGKITFPILLEAPTIGLINDESARIELASLKRRKNESIVRNRKQTIHCYERQNADRISGIPLLLPCQNSLVREYFWNGRHGLVRCNSNSKRESLTTS
jgi:hypothetical protein